MMDEGRMDEWRAVSRAEHLGHTLESDDSMTGVWRRDKLASAPDDAIIRTESRYEYRRASRNRNVGRMTVEQTVEDSLMITTVYAGDDVLFEDVTPGAQHERWARL